MNWNWPLIISFGAVILLQIVSYWYDRRQYSVLNKQFQEMADRVSIINAGYTPMFTALLKVVVPELTHFHTPEADDLLARIATLKDDEMDRLEVLMRERESVVDPQISPKERATARALPWIARRAREEAQVGPDVRVVVQMVSTSLEVQEPK
jgi:hypothetical protein